MMRARVTPEQKRAIDQLAQRRQLRPADIMREALRFYLRAHTGQLGAAEREIEPALAEA